MKSTSILLFALLMSITTQAQKTQVTNCKMLSFEKFQKLIHNFNLPTLEFCSGGCTVSSVPTFISENKESKFTVVLLSFTQDTHSRLTLKTTLKKIRLINNNNTINDNPVALVVSGRSYMMANGEIGIKFKTKKEADLIMIFKDVDKGDKIIIEDFIEADITENSLIVSNETGEKEVPKETKEIYEDSTIINVAKIHVGIYKNYDTTKITAGTRELYISDDGNIIALKRSKTPKFNGHWGGVDLGLNGFLLPDFNTSLPKDLEYLSLSTTKSVVVNVNFYEQNIAFTKNKKLGMVTGLGMTFNNYRFSNDTRLTDTSSVLLGLIDEGIDIRKSKLTAFYFNIPLLFEFQTNNYHKKNSFHINLGVIMGVKVSSHTKKYYDELDKEFKITQYNPESNEWEPEYIATSPSHKKEHNYSDFHMNPFKFDATVRIGWSFLNLFATYSVNTMFKENKGPEIYPWTAGITLLNF